ncbi:unnamed protein product [Caenorhabditis angaria]|uniref:Uncharacterized protein n=1 Tax=Caenorhabditis angaria TaxID=860376 RepID=A0A9P1IK61_9PELO|nr:unnamed protein product [Caenorhabditis angaria]
MISEILAKCTQDIEKCLGVHKICHKDQQIIMTNENDCTKDGAGNECLNKEGHMGICQYTFPDKPPRCCPDISASKDFPDFLTRMKCKETTVIPLQLLKTYCKDGFLFAAGKKTLKNPGAQCTLNSDCETDHYCMRESRGPHAHCFYVAPKGGGVKEAKNNNNVTNQEVGNKKKNVAKNEDDEDNNVVMYIIIFVAIIALALLACAGTGFYYYRKKKAARKAGNKNTAASKPFSKVTNKTGSKITSKTTTTMTQNPKTKFPSKAGTTTTTMSANPGPKFPAKTNTTSPMSPNPNQKFPAKTNTTSPMSPNPNQKFPAKTNTTSPMSPNPKFAPKPAQKPLAPKPTPKYMVSQNLFV